MRDRIARLAISEAAFQRQILDLARLRGWRTAHFQKAKVGRSWQTPVMGDGRGFPDLILIRAARILAVELKVGRNQPTPDQLAWLAAFQSAGVPSFVWRPEQWPKIQRVLW